MGKPRAIELVKPGELDKVPPGKWAAIKDGKVIAWADTLKELIETMEKMGYNRRDYAVIKVPSHDIFVV